MESLVMWLERLFFSPCDLVEAVMCDKLRDGLADSLACLQ